MGIGARSSNGASGVARRRWLTLVTVLCLPAARLQAADVVIGSSPGTGDRVKLLINEANADPLRHKIVFSAKDADVVFTPGAGAVDDPVANGATAVVFSATDCECIDMAAAPATTPGWAAVPGDGTPKRYKWKDDASKSTALVTAKKIKFTRKGGLAYGLDETPQGETEVQVRFGNSSTTLCTRLAPAKTSNDSPTKYTAKEFKAGFGPACSTVPAYCPVCGGAGSGVLVDSDFAGEIPSHWVQYATPGTGQVSLVGGAARSTVMQTASSCCYADAEINDWMTPSYSLADPMPWQYVTIDFRLRTSNVNACPDQGLTGTGVGSRGWGLWDGTIDNVLWFLSLSSESANCGYTAMSRGNGSDLGAVAVGYDMSQWHDYRIVWRPVESEFYVDGNFVAALPPPTVRMGLVFWLDNAKVLPDNSVAYLSVPEEQFVDVDWIRVYTSRARFTDAAGTDVASYSVGGTVTVTVDDPDENLDRNQVELKQATVSVAGSGDTETLTLTETGPSSGEFRSVAVALQSGAAVAGDAVLQATAGDTLALRYVDADDSTDSDSDTAAVVP